MIKVLSHGGKSAPFYEIEILQHNHKELKTYNLVNDPWPSSIPIPNVFPILIAFDLSISKLKSLMGDYPADFCHRLAEVA